MYLTLNNMQTKTLALKEIKGIINLNENCVFTYPHAFLIAVETHECIQ